MKKVLIILLLLFVTTVNASKIYLFSNNIVFKTNNDNYNYGDYVLEQNEILVIPPEKGLLANDVIKSTNYVIHLFENSDNSNIDDIELNETTGSITYIPSDNVVGEVSFKYYIEYSGKITNTSYIYFYVKNTSTDYNINFYFGNIKILPSITKKTSVNEVVTENAISIDEYKSITNSITKKMEKDNNNFDFYYEKIPNTGI